MAVGPAEPSVPLAEHAAVVNQLEHVTESLAGLEQLAREDVGWRKLGMEQQQTFTQLLASAEVGSQQMSRTAKP